jgi:hypothetical protein
VPQTRPYRPHIEGFAIVRVLGQGRSAETGRLAVRRASKSRHPVAGTPDLRDWHRSSGGMTSTGPLPIFAR